MSDAKRAEKVPLDNKPIIEIEHPSYQPSKAELEAELSVPPHVTVDDLARLVMRDVTVVHKKRRKSRG
ncbi:MAG: hypothetical protein OXH85_10620 [Truepera sp.]|nr:hypothetical protein [Truepera sp.]